MAPLTLAKIAIRALLRNRMRTFLSVLGIVIGVAAVIAMVAMGEGSRISIKEQMTSMGSNAIIIMPNRDRRGEHPWLRWKRPESRNRDSIDNTRRTAS